MGYFYLETHYLKTLREDENAIPECETKSVDAHTQTANSKTVGCKVWR